MAFRVEVYESRWVRIIQTGDGNRWNRKKADQIKARAQVLSPKRSGRLAASHRVAQERNRLGQYQSGFRVSAEAPYAAFVHEGTGIYGPAGRPIVKLMSIPAGNQGAGYSGPRVIRHSRGQRPQPWLERAGRAAAG